MSTAAATSPRTRFSIAPYDEVHVAAVRAFNDRMRAGGAPTDFLLPDQPNGEPAALEPAPVAWTKYVVVDDEGEVRGGFLLMTQPGWLSGEVRPVANYQAPLSEGIHDTRFGIVGLQMLRHVQRAWPLTFAVGMGGADRPLPRLLTAAAWDVQPVPWLFRMVRPRRVLRELRLLRERTPLRVAAKVAAGSGAASLAAAVVQARVWPGRLRARRTVLDRVRRWDAWADDLWARTRDDVAFAVVRDRRTLECLYPTEDARYLMYVLREGGAVVAWAVCLSTQMAGHAHFGDLRVATVLDVGGLPAALPALVSKVSDALEDDGADLLMTNQSRADVAAAFRDAGFLAGPSNYLFAASPALSRSVEARRDRVHVTRGDGDGRIHL